MNQCGWIRLFVIGALAMGSGCQHTTRATTRPGMESVAPAGDRVSGSVSDVNLKDHVITVKLVWQRRSFAVAPDCRIITATNDHAELADLKPGDDVELVTRSGTGLPVARRIAVKGVTRAEREADREADRLERILTPNPAERAH